MNFTVTETQAIFDDWETVLPTEEDFKFMDIERENWETVDWDTTVVCSVHESDAMKATDVLIEILQREIDWATIAKHENESFWATFA